MSPFFHLAAGLLLVIFQTTMLNHTPGSAGCYDLLAPYVVFLGLNRPVREAVAVALPLALLMDSISGAPFGLYTSAYFWIYAAVRGVIRVFRVGGSLLLPLVLAAAVLFEDLLFAAVILLMGDGTPMALEPARTMAGRFAWALFTGPLVYWLAQTVQYRSSAWQARLAAGQNH